MEADEIIPSHLVWKLEETASCRQFQANAPFRLYSPVYPIPVMYKYRYLRYCHMFQVAIAPSPLVSRVITAPSPVSAAVTAPSSPALSSGSTSTASLAAGQQKVQIVKTADGKIQVRAAYPSPRPSSPLLLNMLPKMYV
jgi:hypothetical protein